MSFEVEHITGLENEMLLEWRKRSRAVIYQTDPVAWMWDVLGERWWSLQEEIAHSFVENTFTIVKSCNGVGKTKLAGDLVTWFVSVFPPMETMALVSAPVRSQIDENMFNYLRSNYHLAEQRGRALVGEITRWPKWVTHSPYDKDLVIPKRPADQNLISSFQGLHFDHMAVVLDEAGGLQEDFYIGANAVTTNEHARILAIGNPDVRNTAFHRRFSDRETYVDWNTFSIPASATPNFTGESIYPEDPERDKKVKARLVQTKWAETMRRQASPGVIAAKVDAEFPGEDDNTFFSQLVINRAWNRFGELVELEEAGRRPRVRRKHLGVDVAFAGSDKNVIVLNDGGLIKRIDKWGVEEGEEKVEDMAIAKRVHDHAQRLGVHEVRIDASGTSRGVHSLLKTEEQFAERSYVLIGIVGAQSSPNPNRFLNARAWHYDQMRMAMSNGEIGLNPKDADLRMDLEIQTYKLTLRNLLQITSKEELKKDLKHSPDDLDATIYSVIDLTGVADGPAAGARPGDIVEADPYDDFDMDELAGMPI